MFEEQPFVYDFVVDPTLQNTSTAKFIQLIGPRKRVLEVGCANGRLSAYLTQELDCEVIGIEMNLEAVRRAELRGTSVINADVEKDALDRVTGLFDVITFGDVLEHLRSPGAVLLRCKDRLAENGFVLVSIPNVAHYRVRLDLLRGRFDYQPTGLMDRTHLRFFTLRSARQLLIDAGYTIQVSDIVYEFRGDRFVRPGSRLESIVKRRLAGLVAMQFIFKAAKIRHEGR